MNPAAIAQANAHKMPHRPNGRLAGGRIHDLAALGKVILLRPDEAKKFNHAAVGYSASAAMPRVNGQSDASGEWATDLIIFQKKG